MTALPGCDLLLERVAPTPAPADLVTVAVSLHNYARFLPDCLASVAAQHYAAVELIVVDDASARDESAATAQRWLSAHAARFHRVLLLRHRRNQGLAQTRNTGFAAARAAAVLVLDADNLLYPRAIARMVDVARREGFAAVYPQLELFGAEARLGLADVWNPDRLAAGNYIDALALVAVAAWRAVGGYTHLDGGWEDYDFWCKLAEAGLEACYVPEILARYRVHPASMLRTEHPAQRQALATQMQIRHPWLRLG